MARIDLDCAAYRAIPGGQQASARNLLHSSPFAVTTSASRSHSSRRTGCLPSGAPNRTCGMASKPSSRVLHTLDGAEGNVFDPSPLTKDEGEVLLAAHTDGLFGPAPEGRTVRIMVTMPGEAAADYVLIRDLIGAGMDCMRINCAHDDATTWGRIIEHLRRANGELRRECRVTMDIGGPKLRTGALRPAG